MSLQSPAPAAGADPLPLLEPHLPPAPPFWPPAPGWWLVAAVLAIALIAYAVRRHRDRRRVREFGRFFDASIDAAEGAPARIAMMSELLRRAARRRDPAADRLGGDDWLRFLDEGQPIPAFSAGVGRSLLEGGFRRDVSEQEYAALRAIVRDRFVELMRHEGPRRSWRRPSTWWPATWRPSRGARRRA